jgi:hypothetical protein
VSQQTSPEIERLNEASGHLSDPLCRTENVNASPCPDRITSRRDASALWLHLLERGLCFHWEEDPAEWGLAEREVAKLRRLFGEVDRLGAETFACYADADALRQLALLGALPRPLVEPTPISCRSQRASRAPDLRAAA